VSEQMTQVEFVNALESMFLSKGWLQCFKPELDRLRHEKAERLIYNYAGADEIMAAREAIILLDEILGFEGRVRQIAETLRENPQEAGDVVNLGNDADSTANSSNL
jgi:hypothetical protein